MICHRNSKKKKSVMSKSAEIQSLHLITKANAVYEFDRFTYQVQIYIGKQKEVFEQLWLMLLDQETRRDSKNPEEVDGPLRFMSCMRLQNVVLMFRIDEPFSLTYFKQQINLDHQYFA